MITLRERLEAIRDRNDEFFNPTRNSDDYIDAVAALAILDESKRTFGKYEGRIVPDPEAKP